MTAKADLVAELGKLGARDPEAARLMGMIVALAGEVFVLKAQVERLTRALEAGGTAPAVLNAANEEAVSAFLQGRIGFLSIPDTVAATLDAMPVQHADSLDALLAADARARSLARSRISP